MPVDRSPSLGAILALLFVLSACSSGTFRNGGEGTGAEPGVTEASDLEQKIGRMLLVGFRGRTLAEAGPVIDQIRAGQVGGVVLYDVDVVTGERGRNIESPAQVERLVADLQALTEDPLLVAIDQEGGRIARLTEGDGFPPTRSQKELAAEGVAATRVQAEQTAASLDGLGINLNFAPVVDVDVDPESPAIGALGRSFSADPEVVAAHAGAVVAAHRERGIATALKHFPGHGSATGDSHLGFVDVTTTWSQAELEPYRRLIDAGLADLVMTAHVVNRDLDPEWPATLSPPTITGLLRGELGFEGVVVSDDLQMGAIAEHYGLETALRQALLAGVDLLVFANNTPRGYQPDIAPRAVGIIASLVEDGTISEVRIEESVARLDALRTQTAERGDEGE